MLFQSVPKLLNFNPSPAPFRRKGKGCEALIDVWCVSVCACVVVREGFTIRVFVCCSLLWCNTGATDKSELMNGKLLLMIVKTLLSPHVVLGHLSATEMDLQAQTHSHTSHTLISCFPVAVATDCRISFLVPLRYSSPFLSLISNLLLS